MKFRNGIILSLLVVGGLCSNVFAATNPSEADQTSTGTSDISVVIPKLVKISGINDLTSTTYTGSGGLDMNDNVCVYSNMATGSGLYTVKVTGSDSPGTGTGAAFNVGNSSSNQVIPFEVEWNDVTGTG